jgi:hypothetical protein
MDNSAAALPTPVIQIKFWKTFEPFGRKAGPFSDPYGELIVLISFLKFSGKHRRAPCIDDSGTIYRTHHFLLGRRAALAVDRSTAPQRGQTGAYRKRESQVSC